MKYLKKLFIFLFNNIINFIYPPNCLLCGKGSKDFLCFNCKKLLESNAIYRIYNVYNNYYIKHIYLFKYSGLIRKIIINYKFNNKAYLNEVFLFFLLKNEKICRFFKTYDIITPVPIHKKRKNIRGYNQSQILAKRIANKYENIEYKNLLIKIVNNKPQSILTREKRIENIKNVYTFNNKEKILGKNIIILDDIYTTGSTVKECAKVLKQNGANNIIVLTIAKD